MRVARSVTPSLCVLVALGATSVLAQGPSLRDGVAAWAPESERLPRYRLAIQVEPTRGRFTLRERLLFTNTTGLPLEELVLRVYANVAERRVALEGGECPDQRCVVREQSASVWSVRPEVPLAPGEVLTVDLQAHGRARRVDRSETTMAAQQMESLSALLGSGHGSPRDHDYGLLSYTDDIFSLASFYPVVARRAGNDWVREEASRLGDLGPDALSNVTARVSVPRGYRFVATGAEQAEGRVDAPLIRDFTLLVSRRFETQSYRLGEVTIHSHYLPPHRAAGQRALDAAVGSLRVFERRFGNYPYRELDVVEAALLGGAGGVEFSGLVTVSTTLYGGAAPAPDMLEFVTAHEVAHQYWHGLVGSDSRDAPFADESLAQFSAVLYFEERFGEERARAVADRSVRMGYFAMRMMGEQDGPVRAPIASFGTTTRYAGLVYGKGAYFYPALREELGAAAFFEALRTYVDRYRFRLAPANGFVDIAAGLGDWAQVRALARHWLDERHGDEDLGPIDLSTMLGGAGGAGGGAELQSLLPQLQRLLGGQGAGRRLPSEIRSLIDGTPGVSEGAGPRRRPSREVTPGRFESVRPPERREDGQPVQLQ